MNAVRGLLRDLVERKLWPIAVLLLAAAVAVPVYLGRSSSTDQSDGALAAVAGQHGAKVSRAAVKLDDQTLDGTPVGAVRNPFKQQHLPKADKTSTGAKDSSSSSGGSSPSGGTSGGDGSVPPLAPSGSGGNKPAAKPETDSLDIYHLTVRVGRAESLKTLKDVARLSPLPSVDDPFMVYTGVLKDGKTAVFLLSSDAKATGDGHCKPSADDCESVEVKEGDTEFFDLTVDGEQVQYELDVLKVTSTSSSSSTKSSATASAASSERHSKAGAALLHNAHVKGSSSFKGAGAYRWLPDQGVLIRTPQSAGARASVSGGAAASSADVAAALPGQPVWHWRLGA